MRENMQNLYCKKLCGMKIDYDYNGVITIVVQMDEQTMSLYLPVRNNHTITQ